MRCLAYLAAFVLALLPWAVAAFVLAVDHAVSVGNVFVLMWQAFLALPWLVLATAVGLLTLLLAAFFRRGRLVGGLVIAVLDAVALGVLVRGLGRMDAWSAVFFLGPAVTSVALATWASGVRNVLEAGRR